MNEQEKDLWIKVYVQCHKESNNIYDLTLPTKLADESVRLFRERKRNQSQFKPVIVKTG